MTRATCVGLMGPPPCQSLRERPWAPRAPPCQSLRGRQWAPGGAPCKSLSCGTPMGDSKRVSYYRRLSAPEQRTYRKSDAVLTVELPAAPALGPRVSAVRTALDSGKRAAVEAATQSLCDGILASLGVPPVVVRVRSVRPADHGGELHGLYTWEDGKAPLIEVWMRTARNKDVVAFRTFLRTFLHEVCHHLDFTLLGLSDTFHTSGFFRRESSLVRQLAGSNPKKRRPAAEPSGRERPRTTQLKLFD